MDEWLKRRIIAKKCITPVIQDNSQTRQSGIYLYTRVDEKGITWFYCGQALNCYERQVSHWLGHEQRIDLSIKSRKWWSIDNPGGWVFEIIEFCNQQSLDAREQYWIEHYMKKGWQTYNLNYGGSKGKQQTFGSSVKKGYHKGVEHGYNKAKKEISHLFDKYIEATIKGTPNKLKQRALDKFNAFIGGTDERSKEN